MNIGAAIRNHRLQKGMSQSDLEKRTGLLRVYLSRVESGYTIPSLGTLSKIADAMELSLSQFFSGSEQKDDSTRGVFLSYSHRSQKYAEILAGELQALGISVWLASKNIRAGESVSEEILKGIKEARLVAFLVEPHSSANSSSWVQLEYMAALEHSWSDEGKILVPVLIGDSEPPSFLRHASALRVRDPKSDWTRTAKVIARLLSEGPSTKRSKAPIKEQIERLNLIEREANALRHRESE